MKIKIGNKNKIKNSTIGYQVTNASENNKSVAKKYPLVTSIVVTFLFGFIFLFSFWDTIVKSIEGLFK